MTDHPRIDPCDLKNCDRCRAKIALAIKIILCEGCVREIRHEFAPTPHSSGTGRDR